MSDERLWDSPDQLDQISLGLFALSVALLVYTALFWLVHRPMFAINLVKVAHAPQHVTTRQIEDVVRRELVGNFFTLNLDQSRAAFAKLPWVRQATLQRRWPATLELDIVEQEAVAVWGDGGLVNRDGDVFQGATDAELPLLNGPEGSSRLVASRFVAVRERLATVGLTPRSLELSARHAWTIELEQGARIALGRANDLAPLESFIGVYPQQLAGLMPRVTQIDLRYRNGFALRSRDGKPLQLPATATGAPRAT